MRKFHFKDEKSDKFWNIELNGNKYIVHYGRTGTDGREIIKEFADNEDAKEEYEDKIESKLKKGYIERTNSGKEEQIKVAVVNESPEKTEEKKPDKNDTPEKKKTAQPEQTSTEIPEEKSTNLFKIEPVPEPGPPEYDSDNPFGLSPNDWLWAQWREYSPDTEESVFDFDSCEKKLKKLKYDKALYNHPDWDEVEQYF